MMDHEFMNAPNPVWKEEFDKVWGESLVSSHAAISLKGGKVQDFIQSLLDKQRNEVIKLIEGKKFDMDNCSCMEYYCRCEHFGRNEILKELLTEIKKG